MPGLRQRWGEVHQAASSGPGPLGKVRIVVSTAKTLLDRREQLRRLALLETVGECSGIPSGWQLILAAHDMMTGFIIPSNTQFYEHYEGNAGWLQFLRFLDDPPTMMDPIGLAIGCDSLVVHLLHVVHTSAGYDVALLHMFDGGLDQLEEELQALLDGIHPRQDEIVATVERPEYHERLLAAVRAYRADPESHWRVLTFDPPPGCEALFEEGIERYGSPGRLLDHALGKPPSLRASVGQWWRR